MNFNLHPQLKKDTFFIQDLELSTLLLMNDSRFPWMILVPRRPDVTEIFDLGLEDKNRLWKEIDVLSKWARDFYKADKINLAALGNIVPQLHIHVIARRITDVAWPKPVWGVGQAIPYPAENTEFIDKIKADLETERKRMRNDVI